MKQPSKFEIFMKAIWPPIYRVVNGVFYFIVNLIKSSVKTAFQMMKGG